MPWMKMRATSSASTSRGGMMVVFAYVTAKVAKADKKFLNINNYKQELYLVLNSEVILKLKVK